MYDFIIGRLSDPMTWGLCNLLTGNEAQFCLWKTPLWVGFSSACVYTAELMSQRIYGKLPIYLISRPF